MLIRVISEDVLVLSNDKPVSGKEGLIPGNDASRWESQVDNLYAKHQSPRHPFAAHRFEHPGVMDTDAYRKEEDDYHRNVKAWRADVAELRQQYRDRAEVAEVTVKSVEKMYPWDDNDVDPQLRIAFEIPKLGFKSVHWQA